MSSPRAQRPARQRVTIEGRELTISSLDRVLLPDGTTKRDLIDHYVRVAPALLPHLRDRPLSVVRAPDGVGGPTFVQKQAASPLPEWVRTLRRGSGDEERDEVLVDEVATLVWLANMSAIELHTPQWRQVDGEAVVDQLVVDLDPGAGVGMAACCEVALIVRPLLAEGGRAVVAKTSGGKGLQVYARWSPADGSPSERAKTLAQQLERERPDLVVSSMKKSLRTGKVLLDWSQNNPAKTTVSLWSVRAREAATVSTPVTWDEVEAGAGGTALRFTTADVADRLAEHGDLFAPLLA